MVKERDREMTRNDQLQEGKTERIMKEKLAVEESSVRN
jgi:hypothetical protein